VSFDSPKLNLKFAERQKFPFRLIPDVTREVGMLYGACDTKEDEFAMRIAYLIGPDGTIVEAHSSVAAATYPARQLKSLRKAHK
jgi:thioredoxin-dependent peroxiredoxin